MYHHESEEIYKLLNYDAILFDVDGTLIDSAPGIINTLKEVFAKMGVDTTNVNLRRYLGPPLRKSFGEHFTDPALIEKATDLYRTSYAVKGSHECAVFPGVPQMLQTLKQAGFILCCFHQQSTPDLCKFYDARLNTVLCFCTFLWYTVEKDGRCISWSRSFRFPLCSTLC